MGERIGIRDSAWPHREAVSPDEIQRIQRARAVAKRVGLAEIAALCDSLAASIRAGYPGRRKGSVSHVGTAMAAVAQAIGDEIWSIRDAIEVPARGPVAYDVPSSRAQLLIDAVRAVDGFEMTEQEALDVLAKVDAP